MTIYFMGDFSQEMAEFKEASIPDRFNNFKNKTSSYLKKNFRQTRQKKRSLTDNAFGTTTSGRITRGVAAAGALGAGALLMRRKGSGFNLGKGGGGGGGGGLPPSGPKFPGGGTNVNARSTNVKSSGSSPNSGRGNGGIPPGGGPRPSLPPSGSQTPFNPQKQRKKALGS